MNDTIAAQYSTGLSQRNIEHALIAAGKGLDHLQPADLGLLEDFHTMGRIATSQLLDLIEIDDTSEVLDAGSGIGGTARAVADRCRLALARTKVVAPIDGIIVTAFVQVGEVAAPSSKLMTICDLSRVWVEAEVDEFDAGRISQGDVASIVAEGHDGMLWEGIVEEVPDQLAERNLTPEDPSRPTDTYVLRVKIGVKGNLPLKLGEKVSITIGPRN